MNGLAWYLAKFAAVFVILGLAVAWFVGFIVLMVTGHWVWALIVFVGGIAAVTALHD